MRTRVSVARRDESERSMSIDTPFRRSSVPSFALVLALAVSGCSAGVATNDFDVARADAAAACAPAGPAPQFTLAGLDAAGSHVLVTSSGSGTAAFAAFVQVQHAGDAALTGGELRPAGTSLGSYAASIPALRPGATYTVTVQGMQDTNRAPECQKSFALALGTVTAR